MWFIYIKKLFWMVLNTLANNKLYSNLIKILSVYNICNRQRLMNCELKLPSSSTCLFNIANLNTTESNNFSRCIYTSFYQIYDNYLPLFCYEKFPFISVFIFFYHTHSKRDKKFWLQRFMTLQISVWCRGCSLSLIALSYPIGVTSVALPYWM